MARPSDADIELVRLQEASARAQDALTLSAERAEDKIGRDLAEIFEAHLAMLQDPQLIDEIRETIQGEGIGAEKAVRKVFRGWEQKFRQLDDPVFRERADDVVDVARRLLRSLAGHREHSLEEVPEGSILIAERLLPSEVVFLNPERVMGIVVEQGGPGSHCSLLARGIGIPKVARVPGLLNEIRADEVVLVDAGTGEIVLSPSKDMAADFRARMEAKRLTKEEAIRSADRPVFAPDGRQVPIMANIAGRHDAELAATNGADGIGLFRIESIYLKSHILPSEDELFEILTDALAPVRGMPISIRLLDVGGDKEIPSLKLAPEPNPFLGRRGVRLLVDYPEMLDCELRVFIRLAADHDLRILIPMVTDVSDILHVKSALKKCAGEIPGGMDLPKLGAMIETPAAALFTREICAEVDFVSIGTNDLTQYVMAAGRGNPLVSRYYQEKHPAVMRMIEMVCVAAAQAEKPVSLCGTLAAWEDSVSDLINAGISSLSMAPPLIPTIKRAVREMT